MPDLEIAARAIASAWKERSYPKIIRLEGFCGVGKTTIAHELKALIGALHLEADEHVDQFDEPIPPYSRCVRQAEFDALVEIAMYSNCPLVLDSVCLEEIAPSQRWGRGLVAYIKELSFADPRIPTWHGGFHLEGEEPTLEPDKSVHRYHRRYRPHETADLIFEVPEFEEVLPDEPFSSERCFDPAGATRCVVR